MASSGAGRARTAGTEGPDGCREASAGVGARLHLLGVGADRMVGTVARRWCLRPTDVNALATILRAEGTGVLLTPGELAHTLQLTTGAVTGIVDRLVRSGHISRGPDGVDRRRVRLWCLEPGCEVVRDLVETLGSHVAPVVAALSPQEVAVVERFLRAVAESA